MPVILALLCAAAANAESINLVGNSDFEQRAASALAPADYDLSGDVEYRYLGDASRDASGRGVALHSNGHIGSGWVSQTVTGLDFRKGRWFRFSFRGLAQDNFAVGSEDLSMRVEFFGGGGRTSYDAKGESIYPLIEQDRRDFSVNGDFRRGGAAVWRTYQLDFWLPFPQVDTVRLSVAFGHAAAIRPLAADFYVNDFSLIRIPDPPPDPLNPAAPAPESAFRQPHGTLIPLGGRWYYEADSSGRPPPRMFDHSNADRLLYHDAHWQAPFDGNMTAWLRAGELDLQGNLVAQDQLIADNVTVEFSGDSMIIHTRGLPNHPTGRFPQAGFGPESNPNYIQEHDNAYYIPLNPKVNPRHIFTAADNSNHALPMGPIGIAVNGVVFFNPFDANSQDASNIMDRCCGHPAPDNTYHYHKYPICINSPWADDGKGHSPLIGWAFDGFPIYGPFESDGVLARDVTGEAALNQFNLHFDPQRGWHYHVTPGKFPYVIGGYWGTEDARDAMRGGRGGMGGPGHGPGMGPENGPGMGPPPFGPPPF